MLEIYCRECEGRFSDNLMKAREENGLKATGRKNRTRL